MVDMDYGCRKAAGKDYYLPRVITKGNFNQSKFATNFNDPRNPLIHVTQAGFVYYAKTVAQKIELLLDHQRVNSGRIYFVWQGTYSTDTFYLPRHYYAHALLTLGYKSDEEKLEELKAKLVTMELAYKNNYSRFQREQKLFEHAEKQLIEAKKQYEDLARKVNPFPEEEEYNYEPDRYSEPAASDCWNFDYED